MNYNELMKYKTSHVQKLFFFNVTNLEVFVGVKTFVSKGTGLFPPYTSISCCYSYGANISEWICFSNRTDIWAQYTIMMYMKLYVFIIRLSLTVELWSLVAQVNLWPCALSESCRWLVCVCGGRCSGSASAVCSVNRGSGSVTIRWRRGGRWSSGGTAAYRNSGREMRWSR